MKLFDTTDGTTILHNYTPHNITLVGDDHATVDLPSEGVARVAQAPGEVAARVLIGGTGTAYGTIAVHAPSRYGAVEGLPEPRPGQFYIVSMMVAQAVPDRADLLIPGTGPADNPIRRDGQIVAVTRLIAATAIPLAAEWICVWCERRNAGGTIQCAHCGHSAAETGYVPADA